MKPATQNDIKELRSVMDAHFETARSAQNKILEFIKEHSTQISSHEHRLNDHDAEIGLLKTAWLHERGR